MTRSRSLCLAACLAIAACSGNSDTDNARTETQMGDVDVLEGSVNDDMIEADRVATPEGSEPQADGDEDTGEDTGEDTREDAGTEAAATGGAAEAETVGAANGEGKTPENGE